MTTAPSHLAAMQQPIAIIGMACLFPEAPDLAAFWNNILACVDAVGEPVPQWDAHRYLASGRIKTPRGGYLKDLYRFDPREFGIMPNSMDGGEPDQFLALRIARDALADAGYLGPEVDHTDTGIVLGHSTYLHRGQVTVIQNNIVLDQTMALLEAALPDLDETARDEIRNTLRRKLPPTNADTAPGLVPNVMTGRIANRLNLRGPNYLVDAACSSSLLAVGAAMDELREGRSRLMIAGGVNASLPADVTTIFTQLGALSGRGKVRPFEAGSDGTLLGEGLGMVVLKRLDDALAEGDRVYAVVRGIGQASDGRGTGLLAPSVDGETLAIRRAYEKCGVDPSSIGLVEAHGTGIPLGDRTEVAALKNVLGPRTGPQGSVAIGSVKSMISHCIPAAGVAGLIKAALALHHRVLPPTLCETVNPELGIEQTPLFVNAETLPWFAPPGVPRRAGIDSFGFGGINAHAVLEEAPSDSARPKNLIRWPFELCLFSAADAAGLLEKLRQASAELERYPQATVAELARAWMDRDQSGVFRLAFVTKGNDRTALQKALAQALEGLKKTPGIRWTTRSGIAFSPGPLGGKLAFLFPGEGSQYAGMFGELATLFDPVRQWFDFWRGLYPAEPGESRTDILFPPALDVSAERRKLLESRLHDMDVGSEAVFVGGQAMFALLEWLGLRPDVMLGHSSGESTALAASGALPRDRSRLADFVRELNAVYEHVLAEGHVAIGALLAVGALPAADVHATLAKVGQGVVVAMDNCANQLVLYGAKEDIDRVQTALTAEGAICMALPFDRGYHTPAFWTVSRAFHDYYRRIALGVPKLPLYSCASAALFPKTPAAVRKLAAAQWSAKVRLRETVLRMHEDGVRQFLEVGPSANLTAFVGDILGEREHLATPTNVRRKHGLEQLLSALVQLWVSGRGFDVARLWEGRASNSIDIEAATGAKAAGVLLDNTMPVLRLTDTDRAMLARAGQQGRSKPEASPAVADVPAVGGAASLVLPFLDRIDAYDGVRLQATCELAVDRDAFLRDHVLSGTVSVSDPDLFGLACVPLMVSLEILAEGCAALAGHKRLCVIENIRAFDWIALDEGELTVDVYAERISANGFRAELKLHQSTLISAEFLFAPDWRMPTLGTLSRRRAPRWDGSGIYAAGMFHGPLFQSLARIDGWNDEGMDAELSPLSLTGFFEPGQRAELVLNPVMLDASGQLAACWTAEFAGTDFNSFPSTIERIELYETCPDGIDGVVLRGRQQGFDGSAAHDMAAPRAWDFEFVDAGGRPIARIRRLVNVFFPVPHRFYQARRDPLGGWLGSPLTLPQSAGAQLWTMEYLSEDFCAQSSSIFLRILAQATLAFEERAEWQTLQRASTTVRQRRQWLMGRLALKEAVRAWVHTNTGELLYPSDVIVRHGALGAPCVDGWWCDRLIEAPEVSLSHNDWGCVAAVAEPGQSVGVDAEPLDRVQHPDWLEASLTAAEQASIRSLPESARGEAALRIWCAKEAAAKSLGTGLGGAPERFDVTWCVDNPDCAAVHHDGRQLGVILARHGSLVLALADTSMTQLGIN